jgi:hypothetical protein
MRNEPLSLFAAASASERISGKGIWCICEAKEMIAKMQKMIGHP